MNMAVIYHSRLPLVLVPLGTHIRPRQELPDHPVLGHRIHLPPVLHDLLLKVLHTRLPQVPRHRHNHLLPELRLHHSRPLLPGPAPGQLNRAADCK
jgi:hypothetical protein